MCWNFNSVEISGSLAVCFMRGVISFAKGLMDLLVVDEHQVLKEFAVGSQQFHKAC